MPLKDSTARGGVADLLSVDRCLDTEAVDSMMVIHRATFSRLVEHDLGAVLVDFLEDAAATYSTLAQRLREARRT